MCHKLLINLKDQYSLKTIRYLEFISIIVTRHIVIHFVEDINCNCLHQIIIIDKVKILILTVRITILKIIIIGTDIIIIVLDTVIIVIVKIVAKARRVDIGMYFVMEKMYYKIVCYCEKNFVD